MAPYHVKAEWDEEAQVWVASSDDVPGLATGADTFEGLIEKLKIAIPELLVENGLLASDTDNVSFEVKAELVARMSASDMRGGPAAWHDSRMSP